MIRIAIVEDHTMVRQTLARLVEAQPDLQVVADVGTAAEALARLPDSKPQVVVTDIRLPDGDGPSLSTRLRERIEGVRIVFLTMHGDRPTVQQAVAAGADGYLLKSAPADEFLEAVRTVAAGDAYITPDLVGTVMALAGGRSPVPADRLTDREREVLRLLAAGARPDEIADELYVAVKTVKNHLSSIYTKLEVESAAQAVAKAYRLRIATVGEEFDTDGT